MNYEIVIFASAISLWVIFVVRMGSKVKELLMKQYLAFTCNIIWLGVLVLCTKSAHAFVPALDISQIRYNLDTMKAQFDDLRNEINAINKTLQSMKKPSLEERLFRLLANDKPCAEAVEHLIKRGVNCDVPYGMLQSTPLMLAASKGCLRTAQLLLDAHAQIDKKNCNGETALMHAIQGGSLESVQLLLERGASQATKNNHGSTPLMIAALYGDPEILNCFVGQDNVAAQDNFGQTALHYVTAVIPKISSSKDTVKKSAYECAQYLIESGLSVHIRDSWGNTPLFGAAGYGEVEIVRLLLNNGARVNETNDRGETPLMVAVAHSNLKHAELLVEHGADIHVPSKGGLTVFHYAARARGAVASLKYLVSKGADIHAADHEGNTALYYAAQAYLYHACPIDAFEYLLTLPMKRNFTVTMDVLAEDICFDAWLLLDGFSAEKSERLEVLQDKFLAALPAEEQKVWQTRMEQKRDKEARELKQKSFIKNLYSAGLIAGGMLAMGYICWTLNK